MTVWQPEYYTEARAEVERLEHDYIAAIDEWEDELSVGYDKVERTFEALTEADEHKSLMWDVFQTHLAIKLKLAAVNENATSEMVTLSTFDSNNLLTAIIADMHKENK